MKIEMSAMEYFKTKNRMTKKCNISCKSCPLHIITDEKEIYCVDLENFHSEKAIEIVYNWGKEHPVKTMMQDFFEKFPDAPKEDDGTPMCCPYWCGYVQEDPCRNYLGNCSLCWNQPIE